MKPIALALFLSAGVALAPGAARAQANDMFPTKAALGIDDLAYPKSWEEEHFPEAKAAGDKGGTANVWT